MILYLEETRKRTEDQKPTKKTQEEATQ